MIRGVGVIAARRVLSASEGAIPVTPLHLHTIKRATTTEERRQAKEFVNTYHSYIKWADRPARKLYWLLYEHTRLVGVWGLSSAFVRPKAVKVFMESNQLQFNQVGNNIVYCLYGSEHRNAGSIFLSLCARDARIWWGERYGDALKALQTFILPKENRVGTVYKAANWTQIGITQGGVSQSIRTLYGADRDLYPNAERRVFKNGEVKYFVREHIKTEAKLIFMYLTGRKNDKQTAA